MDLEELRAVQTRERSTDGLQDLRDAFYEEVADYVESLQERRDAAAEAADDPFRSEEVQSLTDEIETAERVAEAVYERRMGKVVKQASLAAAGMSADVNGLTTEERDLYRDLVDRIEENKSHVLDVLHVEAESATDDAAGTDAVGDQPAGDRSAGTSASGPSGRDDAAPEPPEPPSSEAAADAGPGAGRGTSTAADAGADSPTGADADEPPDAGAAAAMGAGPGEGGGGPEREEPGASDEPAGDGDGDEPKRTTVRITEDVGEILGVDERAYTLEADDVVSLPTENVDPLLAKDAAEKLE